MKKYRKIYIEITNNCNLHCSFCSEVLKPRRNMTIEEFEKILKKIRPYTDYIYLHVKGEPLLHPNIIDFLRCAEQYNLKVNLTTNGTLLEQYAKMLSKCSALNKINISLHCETNDEHYLDKVFKNVECFSKKQTIVYRLWTLKENGLDEKSTKTVERLKEYYHLSPEIVEKIKTKKNISLRDNIYVDKDIEFAWPKITSHKSCGYCYALKTHIAILVDGTVVPCCLDSNGVIPLGNIYHQELSEIIESEKYQELLKSFQDRKPANPLCQSCTFKERL